MKKLFSKLTLFVLLSVMFMPALSFAADDSKIAVVNVASIVDSSKRGKKIQSELQEELKKSQSKFDAQKAEFEKLAAAYEAQKSSLSDSAKFTKSEELAKKQRDLQIAASDMQASLDRKRDVALSEILKDIVKRTEEIAKKNGYSLVLDKRSALYASDAIDISDAVASALDSSK